MDCPEIDYETDIGFEYRQDLNQVHDQESLNVLLEKWKHIFEWKYDFSPKYRNIDFSENKSVNEYTSEDKLYFEVVAPHDLLKWELLSREFGVCTGTIYLQLKRTYNES